ncbi:MAG: hypothetical protein LBT36_04550 [Oscillospiraceae bacterium]|jgi:hypothetical protein|nr:hypothetical protein [Oscillospiraceae bacterium]
MARYVPHTYKNGRTRRILLRIALTLLGVLVLSLIVMFFWFRTYIVSTEDGIRLVIPWLEGYF